MIIKVCGITNAADAKAAIDAGATAIGFNFYPRSPRYIAPDHAAAIPTPGVRRVGVFVNESPARIEEIARIAALDTAQLHGDESPADYPTHLAVWKAVRVNADFTFAPYANLPVEALLLDGPAPTPDTRPPDPRPLTPDPQFYGGSGLTFDWSLAASTGLRIILAGGLDAENVARAIAIAHPWGIDACSRIESAPGIKDHTKMLNYLQAAKAALVS
jgi:phosphoribosylanthranilate isomerase